MSQCKKTQKLRKVIFGYWKNKQFNNTKLSSLFCLTNIILAKWETNDLYNILIHYNTVRNIRVSSFPIDGTIF